MYTYWSSFQKVITCTLWLRISLKSPQFLREVWHHISCYLYHDSSFYLNQVCWISDSSCSTYHGRDLDGFRKTRFLDPVLNSSLIFFGSFISQTLSFSFILKKNVSSPMDKTLLALSLQIPVQKHATSSMKILLHLTWNSDHPNLQKSLAGLQVVLQDLRARNRCLLCWSLALLLSKNQAVLSLSPVQSPSAQSSLFSSFLHH